MESSDPETVKSKFNVYLYQDVIINSATDLCFYAKHAVIATDKKSGWIQLYIQNEPIQWNVANHALRENAKRFGFDKDEVDNDIILDLKPEQIRDILDKLTEDEIYKYMIDLNDEDYTIYELPLKDISGAELIDDMMQRKVEKATFKECIKNSKENPLSLLKGNEELQDLILKQNK